MQTLELFPSIVETYYFPEWIEPLKTVASEVITQTKEQCPNNSTVTCGFNMHYDERIKPIVRQIGKLSRAFLENQGYDLENYRLYFDSFWPQEFSKDGGGFHSRHIHPNTYVSGFFFTECSENTSYPIFHDPRSQKEMMQLPEKNKIDLTSASEVANIRPLPGSLIIFNSFMPHSYQYDSGIDPFSFVHFTMGAALKSIIKQD